MVMIAQFLRCPSPGNEMVGCIQYVLKCSNPKYLHLHTIGVPNQYDQMGLFLKDFGSTFALKMSKIWLKM